MKINKRKFDKILKESSFDKNSSKMNIIADVGNADYYILRAIEELHRSPFNIIHLTDAITLIALAKYELNTNINDN